MKLLVILLAALSSAPEKHPASIVPLSAFGGRITCTAFSINEKKHYWVTANHCIERKNHYFVANEAAYIIEADETDDVAVLKAGVSAPALVLSSYQPVAGDTVSTVGFPLGSAKPVFSYGHIIALDFMVNVMDFGKITCTLFAMPVKLGHSGSPIFHDGQVISIVQIGSSGFSGGLSWSRILKHLAPYTK